MTKTRLTLILTALLILSVPVLTRFILPAMSASVEVNWEEPLPRSSTVILSECGYSQQVRWKTSE